MTALNASARLQAAKQLTAKNTEEAGKALQYFTELFGKPTTVDKAREKIIWLVPIGGQKLPLVLELYEGSEIVLYVDDVSYEYSGFLAQKGILGRDGMLASGANANSVIKSFKTNIARLITLLKGDIADDEALLKWMARAGK